MKKAWKREGERELVKLVGGYIRMFLENGKSLFKCFCCEVHA